MLNIYIESSELWMKNRQHYKGLIRKNNIAGGVKPSDGKNVPDIPDLVIEYADYIIKRDTKKTCHDTLHL